MDEFKVAIVMVMILIHHEDRKDKILMNISDAKRFEYTLSLFKEYLSSKYGKDYPEYQIIWKVNNDLISGNLLRWSSSDFFPRVVQLKVDNEFNVYDDILLTDDNHQDKFPRDMRNRWFDKYQKDWSSPEQIYLNPVVLLMESIKFIKSNDFVTISDTQPIMYGVKYLSNQITLDFLKLDTDCDIKPVSLIEVSKS